MKKFKIKKAGAILLLWIVISSVVSATLTIWILEKYEIGSPKIFIVIAAILIVPVLWILFPSLRAEEKNISLKKEKKFIKRGKPGKAIAELESMLDKESSDRKSKGVR